MSESFIIPKSAITVNDETAQADREELRPGGVPLEIQEAEPKVLQS